MRKKIRRPKNFSGQVNVKITDVASQQKQFIDAHTDDLPNEIRTAVEEVINRKFKKLSEQIAS